MQKINIIYIIYKFTADGSSIALLNLLNELPENEVSPMVIMSKKGSLCKELEIRNIPYHVVPYYLSRYYKFGNLFLDILAFIPLQFYLKFLNILVCLQELNSILSDLQV